MYCKNVFNNNKNKKKNLENGDEIQLLSYSLLNKVIILCVKSQRKSNITIKKLKKKMFMKLK